MRVIAAMWLVLAGCTSGGSSGHPGDGGSGTGAPTSEPAPGGLVAGPIAAELPEPRTEVAGVAWAGRVAVAGGLLLDGGASPRLDLWGPATDSWTAGPDLPIALHHLGMAELAGRIYVAGGYSNQPGTDWISQRGVFSLGPGDRTWKPEPSMVGARGALGLTAAGGRLVAVGGVEEGRLTGRTESWAPGEPSWRPGPSLAEPREHLAATGADGRAYVIGGRRGGIDTNLRSVESWAPGEPAWRSEPDLNDSRGGTSAATAAGRPCVAGGEEPAGTIASVECLVDGAWARVARLGVPRHGLAVAALGDRLHVVGGGPTPGLFVSGAHEVLTVA